MLTRLFAAIPPHMLGYLGEITALFYYLLQGYMPLKQTRRQPVQVDLLLVRGTTLVLVEVKTRAHLGFFPPLSHSQQQRLQLQAKRLAAKFPSHTVRLDLCLVQPNRPWITRYALPFNTL